MSINTVIDSDECRSIYIYIFSMFWAVFLFKMGFENELQAEGSNEKSRNLAFRA